jgi:hypothetical protein
MSDSPMLYDWVERIKAANCPACRMNSVLPCGSV